MVRLTTKLLVIILLGLFLFSLPPIKSKVNAEVIVCPGSGERCAQVYIWGIGLWWKKKDQGGQVLLLLMTNLNRL